MLEILENHLKASASPETLEAITKACEWFEEFDLSGYQDAYTDLLMSGDNADPTNIVSRLVTITQDMQRSILDELSIKVSDEASIQQVNRIIEALKNVESTEFTDEIAVLCTSEADADAALCEILSIVTGESPEYFYPLIQDIDRCVLDRIKMVCQQNQDFEIIDIEGTKKLVDVLVSFNNFAKDSKLFIYEMILGGEKLDLTFSQYYHEIFDKIAELPSPQKALQLIGCALVSSDGRQNPRGVISEQLSKTYMSADEITPIVAAVETTLVKYHSSQTSGVTEVNQ